MLAPESAHAIRRYRPEVDGLRAVAVLPVIFYHAGFEPFSGGFVGVDVFFVISGYLITQIILQGLGDGSFRVANFYERRFRRILPALFLVLLSTVPAGLTWLQPSALNDYFEALVAIVFFASNVLFWQQSDYFAESADANPLLHTWSLSVEEQFYVVFPVLLGMVWKLGWKKTLAFFALGILFSFALSEWGWRNSSVANFFLLPSRAWELLLGAAISVWVVGRGASFDAMSRSASFASWIGLGCIAVAVFSYSESTPFPSYFTLLPTIGTALILMFATTTNAVGRTLSARPLVGIGLISYSLYLWHQPIFAFARLESLDALRSAEYLMLIGLSFGLAYCSWRFVEVPFRDRARVSTRMLVWVLTGVAIALVLIGASGMLGLIGPAKDRVAASRMADKAWSERHVAVKSGICHFNTLGPNRTISTFMSGWDCWGNPIASSQRILVVGDSHAADKALSLWQNNMHVGLMSGADCSLDPAVMTSDCRRQFDWVVEQSAANDVRWILLANRFGIPELSDESLARVVKYWQGSGAGLILFSGMPIYTGFRSILARAAYRQIPFDDLTIEKDERIARQSERQLKKLQQAYDGLEVFNTREAFCQLSIDCGWISGSVILLADHDHLSVAGAKLFGHTLKERLVEIVDDN